MNGEKAGRTMKTSLIILVLILTIASMLNLTAVFAAGETVTVSAEDGRILYMGRWAPDGKGVVRGGFECGLAVWFNGTDIRLNGRASGTVLISVDGGELVQKTLTRDMKIASGLSEGEHLLEMYAAYQLALPVIGGFAIDAGGEFLSAKRGKLIEFVGESIILIRFRTLF